MVHLSYYSEIQVPIGYAETIALVKAKDALLVQALDALPVSPVNRCSKRLVVPNLTTCFN